MGFVSIDYICMLDELYDEYWEECVSNGTPPLTPDQWYKEIYGGI